jgi:hypothetical protein
MRSIAAIALTALVGCGADGGVGGTGISTISGNVTVNGGGAGWVARSAGLADAVDLEGIKVCVRGTSLCTLTDGRGNFTLEGEFAGEIELEFTERNGDTSRLPLDVPSGGIVSLTNVHLRLGQALADRIEVEFEALAVEDAVCDGDVGIVQVTDKGSRGTFTVSVDEDTRFVRDDARNCPDEEFDCSTMLRDRTLDVKGTQNGKVIDAVAVGLKNCRRPGTGR